MRARHLFMAAALLVACSATPPSSQPSASLSTDPPVATGPLVFLEDDVTRAETQAKTDGKLLFVDVWAPWCHTCLAMKHGVFDAPDVAAHGGGFVFASLDGDKDENAAFLGRYPIRVWPTLFVIDPVTRNVVAMYGGSLSVPELAAFLDNARDAHRGKGADADLQRALEAAHAAFAAKDYTTAEKRYEDAAARPWARRSEALIGAMRAFESAKNFPGCGAFGVAHLADVTGASSQADFVDDLRTCAEQSTDIDAKKRILDMTLTRLRTLADHMPDTASVDDRADLLAMLAEAEGTGSPGAHAAQERRAALLDGAAAKAGSPDDARVFDYERMGAYLALGRGDDAVKLFEGRVRDFPDSYEAWARLASTLHAVGRDKDAVPAVEKAIALAYGPRKLRYLGLRAEIANSLGDFDAAVAALEDELKGAKALPPGQFDDDRVKDAEGQLAKAKEARAELRK